MGSASSQKSEALEGGTALVPPPNHSLPSPVQTGMEMPYLSSLRQEIQYRAINTYQLGRNPPAVSSLWQEHRSWSPAVPGGWESQPVPTLPLLHLQQGQSPTFFREPPAPVPAGVGSATSPQHSHAPAHPGAGRFKKHHCEPQPFPGSPPSLRTLK